MASPSLPPPDASTRAGAVETGGRRAARRGADDDGRQPRYGVRRAAVVGGFLAVVAVGAAGVIALTRDGDGESGGASSAPGWRGLVAIGGDGRQATLIDRDGDVGDTLDLGLEATTNRYASGDTLIVGGDGEAAVADLGSGDARVVELPPNALLQRARGTRQLVLVAADPAGGPALVVTPDGEIDVNDVAELEDGRYLVDQLTADPDGEAVLASEITTFQTVLVPLDGDDPTFFAGSGVALTAEHVVTIQRVGPDAEVVITPRNGGDERRIATTELLGVAPGSGGRFVLVAEDGGVSTVAPGADEAQPAGDIDLADGATAESVVPYPAIDRIVVTDGAALHLLDAGDGAVLTTVDGVAGLGATTGDPAQRCAVVATPAGLGTLDLVTGEMSPVVITEKDLDRPAAVSVDGCTVVGQTAAGTSILRDGEIIEVGERRVVAALAPDGSAVVTVDPEGNAELLVLDEPDPQPIALDVPDAISFVFIED